MDNPQPQPDINRDLMLDGNAVAGPVFNKIMKFALQTIKIPPTGDKAPKVRLTAR